MGWIISAAMVKHCKNLPSLPEQVAESLAGICLDGEQSAPRLKAVLRTGAVASTFQRVSGTATFTTFHSEVT